MSQSEGRATQAQVLLGLAQGPPLEENWRRDAAKLVDSAPVLPVSPSSPRGQATSASIRRCQGSSSRRWRRCGGRVGDQGREALDLPGGCSPHATTGAYPMRRAAARASTSCCATAEASLKEAMTAKRHKRI